MHPCKQFGVDYFFKAPIAFQCEREIPTSPEILFAIFEDESSWPKWIPGVAKVKWTSPRPFGIGTTRTVTLIGGIEFYERFIAWDSGKEMSFCFTGSTLGIWSAFGERYQVKDLGGNRSALTWTIAYEPGFLFGKIHFLISPIMEKVMGALMDSLVRYTKNTAPDYAQKLASTTSN